MTREVNAWIDKKMEELDCNKKGCYIKAFGLGCVEGLVDGLAIAGGIYTVAKIVKHLVHKD